MTKKELNYPIFQKLTAIFEKIREKTEILEDEMVLLKEFDIVGDFSKDGLIETRLNDHVRFYGVCKYIRGNSKEAQQALSDYLGQIEIDDEVLNNTNFVAVKSDRFEIAYTFNVDFIN